MKEYKTSEIRNVALAGHNGVGKTSLIEALLHIARVIDRPGTVDAGNTQSDYDPEEIKRKTSINATLFPLEMGGCKVNVLDCPGFRDFVGEIKSALRVADLAVLVVDGVVGPEVGTEFAWSVADELEIPRAIFVNKLDKERANYQGALDKFAQSFSARVVPVALPVGIEANLRGVIDLLQMKMCVEQGGKAQWTAIPDDMAEATAAARAALVEAAAEGDDALTEKFLMEEPLTEEEVIRGMRAAVAQGRFVPALCGCATKELGAAVLLQFLTTIAPSPDMRPGMMALLPGKEEPQELALDATKPLVAYVFKTVNDDYAGRLSFFKVIQGAMVSETTALNLNTGRTERVAHVLCVSGRKNSNVHQIHAGDLGALAKLESTQTGHTLVDPKGPQIRIVPTALPLQTVFMAIAAKSKGEEDKMSVALQRLLEADPSLKLERDAALRQTVLSGMGDMHLEVVVSRIMSAAKVEVELTEPKIPYRETITRKAEGQGKHKKQTGGHGQYGDCWIRLEPLPRGTGFEFEWAIVGGVIPTNYQKAIEKGLRDAIANGILAGYPAIDIKAICYDGSYHAVDSSDIAFQLAARKAWKAVSPKAGPIILEPYMIVKVVAPEEYMGDVMGALSGKRGRITGSNVARGKAVVEAQAPQGELVRFSRELRAMTSGRASFEMVFSHYEPTPPHIQEQIIASAEKKEEEED